MKSNTPVIWHNKVVDAKVAAIEIVNTMFPRNIANGHRNELKGPKGLQTMMNRTLTAQGRKHLRVEELESEDCSYYYGYWK